MTAGERNLARQLHEEAHDRPARLDSLLFLWFACMTLLGGVIMPLYVLVFLRPQFPDLADVILVAVGCVWVFVALLWLEWRRSP